MKNNPYTNRVPFGLLTKAEQRPFRQAGANNCTRYGIKRLKGKKNGVRCFIPVADIQGKARYFIGDRVYRIKKDYV